MSNGNTHACSLTIAEINSLIQYHGGMISANDDTEHRIERLVYLNKRLRDIKAKEEVEVKPAAAGWDLPAKG